MILVKRVFKFCLYLSSAIVLVLLIEAVYFYRIIQRENTLAKADAIIVFNGFRERVDAGYKLTNLGYAPHLVISPADAPHLATYLGRYGLPESAKVIREDKARTTFENAYYTGEIIRKNRFRSIILVTSLYHLPRSLFLCRALLIGQDIQVQTYSPPANRDKLWVTSGGRRLIHKEMIRFWGSLSELLYCKAAGGVPEKSLKEFGLVKWVRSLFSI